MRWRVAAMELNTDIDGEFCFCATKVSDQDVNRSWVIDLCIERNL